jgi:hypothetical protein
MAELLETSKTHDFQSPYIYSKRGANNALFRFASFDTLFKVLFGGILFSILSAMISLKKS